MKAQKVQEWQNRCLRLMRQSSSISRNPSSPFLLRPQEIIRQHGGSLSIGHPRAMAHALLTHEQHAARQSMISVHEDNRKQRQEFLE